jgi:hypothetical protein
MIPVGNTGGLQVRATSLNLLSVRNTGLARGAWLNPGTAREPVAVLGSAAAQRLGIDRIFPDQRIWLGGQWFNVAGVLKPSPLEPDIDNSALIGYPAAQKYLGYVSLVRGEEKAGPPSSIYVRAATGHEAAVQSLLAQTANPEAPNEVNVSQPSDALTARAAAAGAFDSLFLGLGVVALIVGAVGVANIMIISVLERRSEIGLRRALGATKSQIRTQFLGESILLAVIGGIVGVGGRGLSDGHLRRLARLGHRDPRRGVVGRHRLGHPDRRVRRPDAGRPSVPDAAHRGTANSMRRKWDSIERPPCGRAFAVSVASSSAARLDIQPPRRSLVQAQRHSTASRPARRLIARVVGSSAGRRLFAVDECLGGLECEAPPGADGHKCWRRGVGQCEWLADDLEAASALEHDDAGVAVQP